MLVRRTATLLMSLAIVTAFAATPAGAHAPGARIGRATHDVAVGHNGTNFFDATSNSNMTTIKLGDAIHWTWEGTFSHSSTRNIAPETWGSNVHGNGFTFDHTFNTAGTFVYWCTVHGSPTTGMRGFVTVTDPNAPTVSIGDLSHAEGNTGTTAFDFPVTLSKTSASDVTVHYSTANGTATAPGDYTAVSNGTVTITAGQTSAVAEVLVNGDATSEPDETFTVTLSTSSGATISDGTAAGTIQNDDGAPPTPSMSINDITVKEGNSKTTTATFTVTLSSPAVGTVTAHYATSDGTATAPSDYQSKSGTVSIGNGLTTGSVTVSVVGDQLKEPNETFTVTLSTPSSATINDGTGTGTISDTKDTCTIVGTNGDDTLSGTGGPDTLCGLKGNDTLSGLGGDDSLLGAAGNDTLTGGGGADVLKGAGGDDTLHGTDGVAHNDTVNGGAGTDACDADTGDTVTACP
jgi:plastocyanin